MWSLTSELVFETGLDELDVATVPEVRGNIAACGRVHIRRIIGAWSWNESLPSRIVKEALSAWRPCTRFGVSKQKTNQMSSDSSIDREIRVLI